MKRFLKIISLTAIIAVVSVSLPSCKTVPEDTSSVQIETQEEYVSEIVGADGSTNAENGDNATRTPSGKNNTTATPSNKDNNGNSNAVSSDNKTNNNTSTASGDGDSSDNESENKSKTPDVTICAAVASNIYIVGGVCSKDTEYITVSGNGIETTKITAAKGQSQNYFIGQVKVNSYSQIEVKCKEIGKELSSAVKKTVSLNPSLSQNLMTKDDYRPVFSGDSRMHFYSSVLSYTKSNIVSDAVKSTANMNISATVNAAKSVGAEVIYLVVPSSAAVYPETLPSEYTKASGESLYDAFSSIATSNGAKVIYPLDTMKSHKNDGDGYKIYSHTDSHWTTYGAYYGVSELMNYISIKYPSAKPRTVSQMGFYVTELSGGDSLFSFNDSTGFENAASANSNNAATVKTKINELTTLYSLKMPTDTLSAITRNKKSIYLTKANADTSTFINPNGSGLPSAVIVRDSFGRTAYDMVNDRFSKIDWLAEGDYTNVDSYIYNNRPNYVIYIVSERNLFKVMLGTQSVSLTDMAH